MFFYFLDLHHHPEKFFHKVLLLVFGHIFGFLLHEMNQSDAGLIFLVWLYPLENFNCPQRLQENPICYRQNIRTLFQRIAFKLSSITITVLIYMIHWRCTGDLLCFFGTFRFHINISTWLNIVRRHRCWALRIWWHSSSCISGLKFGLSDINSWILGDCSNTESAYRVANAFLQIYRYHTALNSLCSWRHQWCTCLQVNRLPF